MRRTALLRLVSWWSWPFWLVVVLGVSRGIHKEGADVTQSELAQAHALRRGAGGVCRLAVILLVVVGATLVVCAREVCVANGNV